MSIKSECLNEIGELSQDLDDLDLALYHSDKREASIVLLKMKATLATIAYRVASYREEGGVA